MLISTGHAKGQESLLRFRQRLIKIGLFETFEIEVIYQPTKAGLEAKLQRLEQQIEVAGRDHLHNTFFMVYYFGLAEMIERRVVIQLYDEPNSNRIVRYSLEDRIMSINQSRFIYTIGVLDCPRPIVHLQKRKPTPAAVAVPAQKPAGSSQQTNDEQKRNVILIYACAAD